MKNKILLLLIILNLLISCKKVNLLTPSIIPPPTEFKNNEKIPQYPTPSPVLPIPPEKTEEKNIVVTPEIVKDGTVFGGYGRRFKFKNEWHILATNEYKYDPNTKILTPTGKGAILKIDNNGKTITKIHSLSLGDNLEKTEYWTNLNSRKVLIEESKVRIPTSGDYGSIYTKTEKKYEYKNIKYYNTNFKYISSVFLNLRGKETSDLINWIDSPDVYKKEYILPKLDFDNPNFQGRIGSGHADTTLMYFKGKFLLFTHPTIYDYYTDGFIPPSSEDFYLDSKYYYSIDVGKDTSDPKNWQTNETPWGRRTRIDNYRYDGKKMYMAGGNSYAYKYKASEGYWYLDILKAYLPTMEYGLLKMVLIGS